MDDDDKDERNDEENENESEDNNNNNGGGGSCTINKYFGKADKNIKLATSRFKSNFKVPKTQKKINYTIESSTKNYESRKEMYEKSKIKFEYASSIERLIEGKIKAKLAIIPLDKKNKFSELGFNLKRFPNKNSEDLYDIKLNNQYELITKLKRIRYYMNKSIKHQMETQINVNSNFVYKLNFNFDSLQKIDFQNRFKYLKGAHLKGKLSTKLSPNKFEFNKLQFIVKLFSQAESFKLRTQNKFALNWGKNGHEVKGNFQISDKNKVYTFYSSANAYIWGIKHDESKFLYSLTQNWKVGASYNYKGPEFVIQNGKLDNSWISSFGLYSSVKNITMIIKNKLNKNRLGKINYQLALQSKFMPKSLNDLTFGVTLNINK